MLITVLTVQNRRPRRTSVARTTRRSNVPFDWPVKDSFNDTANQNLVKGGHHSYIRQGLDAAYSGLTSFGTHERHFIQSFSLKERLTSASWRLSCPRPRYVPWRGLRGALSPPVPSCSLHEGLATLSGVLAVRLGGTQVEASKIESCCGVMVLANPSVEAERTSKSTYTAKGSL